MAGRYLYDLLGHLSNSRGLCVKYLFSADFASAQKIALKIYEEHPHYLLLSLYMDLPRGKPLLLHLLKKMAPVDPAFVLLLVNDERLSCADLRGLGAAGSGCGFVRDAIERDWFLRSCGSLPARHDAEEDGAGTSVVELLDRIDDFRLYQHALEHNIDIPKRSTANYKWYQVHRDGDKTIALELIKKTTNFQDILRLCQLAGITETGIDSYDILIRFLLGGYSGDLLRRAVALFLSHRSFANCKILLALLVASRIESNLVLALYISGSATFEDNYEIELVQLFLNRYFCFHNNIHKLMRNMSIKNIQIYNNAYIWTDPMIVSGVAQQYSCRITMLRSFYRRDLSIVEAKVPDLLDSGRIGHAASLLKLREELKGAVCMREVAELEILSSESRTVYSGLLGGPCSYLFDKLTAGHSRTGKSCLGSIFAHPDGAAPASVLYNPYIKIDCPKFLYEFAGLTASQTK